MITGFEPFGKDTVNSSWEAVSRLEDRIGDYELTKLLLPTVFGKAAERVLAEAETLCPDVILCIGQAGGRSAVDAAVATAKVQYGENLIDSFVLGNPHEGIFPAIYGTTHVEHISSLGILETFDAAAIIVAADAAAKTADVELIELRIAKGMCGKSYVFLCGEVSAVEAAIARARECVSKDGMYLDSTVIAHPDPQICKSIL